MNFKETLIEFIYLDEISCGRVLYMFAV